MDAQSRQLVLVTGGSGFVGSHILETFLSAGYAVRAAVRSENTATKVRLDHSTYGDRLTFVIVPDITVPHAFDDAVRGVDGVIHAASPYVINVTDNERELLLPAIRGTTEILQSVSVHAPLVKRVVITSSFAAANDPSKGLRPGYTYTEDDWNPVSYDSAKAGNGRVAYVASKKFAEAAAWELMQTTFPTPTFTLATILPPMIYGPLLNKPQTLEKLNTSSADIYRLMNGTLESVPKTGLPALVDVRDVAAAHLRAYENSEGGRYLVSGGSFTYQMVCDILREKFPELGSRIPSERCIDGEHYTLDTSKASRVLGLTFRSAKQCFEDMGRRFIDIGENGAGR